MCHGFLQPDLPAEGSPLGLGTVIDIRRLSDRTRQVVTDPLPPGQAAVPFHVGEHHVGFDTYDMTTQQGTSQHYLRHDDGTVTYGATNFRYIWPAECDLMAQLAGLELESRSADWRRASFTNDSENRISVWRKVC